MPFSILDGAFDVNGVPVENTRVYRYQRNMSNT
jgi:hypothetical protein